MASDSSSGGSTSTETDELTMQHELDIIELHAAATSTPMTKGTVISDTFLDVDGYLDSVDTVNTDAEFYGTQYGRSLLAWGDDFDRANNAVVGNGWAETETNGVATIETGRLKMVCSGAGFSCNHALTDLTPLYIKIKMENSDVTKCNKVAIKHGAAMVLGATINGSQIQVPQGTNRQAAVNNTEYLIEFKNINWTAFTYDVWIDSVEKATGVAFDNNEAHLDDINIATLSDTAYTVYIDDILFSTSDPSVAQVIVLDLPSIDGEVTATELIINSPNRETGDGITYEIEDTDTTKQSNLAIDIQNNLASVDGTKLGGGKLRITLTPKATAPTIGYPSVRTYALKLWKA